MNGMPRVCDWLLTLPASFTAASVATKSKQEPCTFSLGLHLVLQMGQTCLGAGIAVPGGAFVPADTVQQAS